MTSPHTSGAAGSGARVLLVEDDEDQALFVRRWLERAGAETVRFVTDLAATRATLATEETDLVLLDLSLPDSTLDETIEAIGSLARTRDGVRVIAMSALDDADVKERVIANGAAGFLAKNGLCQEALEASLGQCNALPTTLDSVEAVPTRGDADSAVGPAFTQLAHDAHTWIANATFRVSALRRLEERNGSDEGVDLAPHLDSIELSLDGLTHHVRAARALALDGLRDWVPRTFSLDQRLDGIVEECRRRGAYDSVVVRGDALPETIHADVGLVRCVLDVFMENVSVHGAPRERRTLTVSGVPEENAIALSDDGGPWGVPRISNLGTAGFRGDRRSPRAGFGLFRARRLLTSTGGSLAFDETSEGSGVVRAVARFGATP